MHPYIVLFGNKMGTFPLCVGIGLFAIVLPVRFQLKKISSDPELENKVMIAIPLSMVTGVIAAYLLDVLFRGGVRALLRPWGYGFTFYGWLIGCIAFYWIYEKLRSIKPGFLFNLFLPAFSLAQAIGRIGCFCGGCCYGAPSDTLGIRYPAGSLPYSKCGDTPLIPVQLIESAYLLLVFAILFLKIPFRKRAGWYLILMPAGRFLLEFLRGDDRGSVLGLHALSPSQMISIFLIFAGIFVVSRRKAGSERSKELSERKNGSFPSPL